MKRVSIEDIKPLADKIKNNFSLCEFLGMAEAEYMVATTIHACVINNNNHGKPFSFRGNVFGTSGHGLINNGAAYAMLLEEGLLVEGKRQGKVIIWPTQLLIDKLNKFFA